MGKILNYDGATLRASLGLYNDVEDVDKLIVALKETLKVI
jgi:selenocysteine lyase/cysteine desulfurase